LAVVLEATDDYSRRNANPPRECLDEGGAVAVRLNDVSVLIGWNQKVTSEQIGFALLLRWRITAPLVVVKMATPPTVKKNVTSFVKKAEPQ
jgi:hypothetical protein